MHTNNICTCNDMNASMQRVSWKNALITFLGAPSRLHHYRDVRTRMLHDALADMDYIRKQGNVNDE